MTPLQQAQEHVADHLDQIKTAFKPDAKVTVIVRSPGNPERDFVMTDDDWSEIKLAVERGEKREKSR